MTEIRSKVTLENIIRKGILTVIVAGFAIAFGYDAYVRYPRKNVEQAKKTLLDPVPEQDPPIHPGITSASTRWIKEQDVKRVQEVIDRFGPPGWEGKRGLETTHVYFGPAYVLKLTSIEGVIRKVERIDATYKGEGQIRTQKILFVVLAVLSLPVIWHYLRVLTYRARLSDDGLKLTGKPLVPFGAMQSLNSELYEEKGWVDITYSLNEAPGVLRLDDYWIKKFKPIVAEICQRTGFEDPVEKAKSDDQSSDEDEVSES